MSKVGIVANPASGRDIRRLVAQAWVVSNQEKSALTARLLRGLEAAGVEQVLYMPEPAGICPKACQKMGETRLRVSPLEVPVSGGPQDSTRGGGGHGGGRGRMHRDPGRRRNQSSGLQGQRQRSPPAAHLHRDQQRLLRISGRHHRGTCRRTAGHGADRPGNGLHPLQGVVAARPLGRGGPGPGRPGRHHPDLYRGPGHLGGGSPEGALPDPRPALEHRPVGHRGFRGNGDRREPPGDSTWSSVRMAGG